MKRFILVGIILFCSLPNLTWGQQASYLTGWEVDVVKRDMSNALNDPESARFGNRFISVDTTFEGMKSKYVCGLINGRNAFGGYTGFKGFVGVLLIEGRIFIPIVVEDYLTNQDTCLEALRTLSPN